MRTAGLRGVEMDVIVSAVVDQRLVDLAQRSFYDELLVVGARIHRYADYLLHAKSVSIDGTLGIVGWSNVDIRSVKSNEEASVILYDPPSVAALETIQRAGYQTQRCARPRNLARAFAAGQTGRKFAHGWSHPYCKSPT